MVGDSGLEPEKYLDWHFDAFGDIPVTANNSFENKNGG